MIAKGGSTHLEFALIKRIAIVGRELGLVVLDNKAEKGGIPIIWRPPFFVFVRK